MILNSALVIPPIIDALTIGYRPIARNKACRIIDTPIYNITIVAKDNKTD